VTPTRSLFLRSHLLGGIFCPDGISPLFRHHEDASAFLLEADPAFPFPGVEAKSSSSFSLLQRADTSAVSPLLWLSSFYNAMRPCQNAIHTSQVAVRQGTACLFSFFFTPPPSLPECFLFPVFSLICCPFLYSHCTTEKLVDRVFPLVTGVGCSFLSLSPDICLFKSGSASSFLSSSLPLLFPLLVQLELPHDNQILLDRTLVVSLPTLTR